MIARRDRGDEQPRSSRTDARDSAWIFLEAVVGRGSWKLEGLCAQVDPDPWFPDQGESSRPAIEVCAGCPVRERCLSYALEGGEKYGVWGGTSAAERDRIRKAGAG